MSLLQAYLSLLRAGWAPAFLQRRTLLRAVEHALALPCALGRRTISRVICALGRQGRDWSPDYRLFSRRPWDEGRLFDPVFADYLARFPDGPVTLAFDDTRLAKKGRKVPGASWHYDPMSPPFRANLVYGLRFIQATLLYPLHRLGELPPRSLPVRFTNAPAVKKPRKRAGEAEWAEYRRLIKLENLSTRALAVLQGIRLTLDAMGAAARRMLVAADGSYCNRTLFRVALAGIDLIARCRKDARLCFPAPPGGRRIYGDRFTPEAVRQDPAVPWQYGWVFYAGKRRYIRYKEVHGVLWQRGAGTRPLRLIVIAPQPYRPSKKSRVLYREPAYALCTDLGSSAELLLQTYFDRWQIEVNHRDEKQVMGVGQAQVRHENSVPRHPAFAVAAYSLLLLAALQCLGPRRTGRYPALPKWRKKALRPSFLDIVSLLRKEIDETSSSGTLEEKIRKNILLYAYT